MAKWLLLACSALLVLHGAPVQSAESCVLDGFDLSELDGARYWNVTLRKHECVVPKGYTAKNVTGCTVHFSICNPLPREICVNQTNSSTCEVVTTHDGMTHYFNIGTSNNELQPTGGNEVGFATIRQGNANDSALCNTSFITIMSFKCEPRSVWDHTKSINATIFAETSVDIETCILNLSFNYSGACYVAPTLAPNRCQLDRYDLSGLQQMDYWFAALPDNRTCIIPGANPCVVYFSFCQGLPLSTGDGCYEAAVCQAGMTSEGNVSYSMGQLNEQTQFFEDRADFTAGGFYIDVEGGDKICADANKKARTRIALVCDPMAVWYDRNLSGKARVTQVDCEYTITIPYAGACLLPASSSAHAPTATPTRSSTGSSTSSNTKVSPNPTSTSHMHFSTSSHGTHTSSQTPVHSPTTGPPSHHTTPEDHHTTPEHPPTTQKKPPTQPTAKPDSSKIAGLTAGLVIFMLIALALLVLFIIAVFYIYKNRKTGEYERLQDSDKM